MLMKVYSPQGEMFEVLPARAKYLTLHKGWTFSAVPRPLFKETSKLNTPPVPENPSFRTESDPEIKDDTDGDQ